MTKNQSKETKSSINGKMPHIELTGSSIPNVLLVGNGICQLYNNNDDCYLSWKELVSKLNQDDTKNIADINNFLLAPIQTQIISNLNTSQNGFRDKLNKICQKMCQASINEKTKKIVQELLKFNFQCVLTTNYSYEIEKSLSEDFDEESKKSVKMSYLLRKYRFFGRSNVSNEKKKIRLFSFLLPNKENQDVSDNKYKSPLVWHIHGEAAKPNSIILDLHHYGTNLSIIQNYVSNFISRYKACIKRFELGKKIVFYPQSWLDYFFLSNVYIVGLGLSEAEFELYWLFNERLRVRRILNDANKKIKLGQVYYLDTIDETKNRNCEQWQLSGKEELSKKKLIAQAFNIKYRNFCSIDSNDDLHVYEKAYEGIINSFETLANNKNEFDKLFE